MNANLMEAVVTGTNFSGATDLTKEQLYSTASYQQKYLAGIDLSGHDLSGWNFSGQNLANADLGGTTLTSANLTGAVVTGASFDYATGFTKHQLYSTASYEQKNLAGIVFNSSNLSGWDFSGQNLANADLISATLTHANLSGANLANAVLASATLTNTNLNGAVVTGGDFGDATGFTKQQLYTTASYQTKNLSGISLAGDDLSGWNFRGQNLTNASVLSATLTNADFSFADTRGARGVNLTGTTSRNAILPTGDIAGLSLTAAGDQLTVRNNDGVADPPPHIWLNPRPPIAVHVQDHLTMTGDGVLQLLFDANPWNSTMSFQAGVAVMLGGTLELTFAVGVVPATQLGRTIDLFDWTGVMPTGTFNVASAYAWNLSNLYTTGEVTLTAVPGAILGDFSGNGVVDAADYVFWRDNFGLQSGATSSSGDGDRDGDVEGADYLVWQRQFGSSALAASANAPVPEPETSLLIVVAAVSIRQIGGCRRQQLVSA